MNKLASDRPEAILVIISLPSALLFWAQLFELSVFLSHIASPILSTLRLRGREMTYPIPVIIVKKIE